jgi:hypothetical protein
MASGRHSRPKIRGRHRRPGQAAHIVTATAGGIAAGGILLASPAQAQVAVPGSPPVHYPEHISVMHARVLSDITVTVARGDTLSGIAARLCGNPADWTGIYNRNKSVIGADWNIITPGEKLTPDCTQSALPVVGGVILPAADAAVQTVDTGDYSGFQGCVIRNESGGNAQIWNPTGHWGLYQFSYSTWVAHGGDPALFGHADAAYQTEIFWNTVARDGTSDWAPYDGC